VGEKAPTDLLTWRLARSNGANLGARAAPVWRLLNFALAASNHEPPVSVWAAKAAGNRLRAAAKAAALVVRPNH